MLDGQLIDGQLFDGQRPSRLGGEAVSRAAQQEAQIEERVKRAQVPKLSTHL